MGIKPGGGVTGKMFATGQYARGKQSVVEDTGEADNLLNAGSPTTSAQRVVCLIVERDIKHRTKIEIETE
jgi:hypothetical protein